MIVVLFCFLVFVTLFQRIYMYRTIYCFLGLFGLFASRDVLKVTESQGTIVLNRAACRRNL